MDQDKPIIFFDGVCNLCNGFVNFLIKYDQKKQFYFASLQGKTAKKLLQKKYTDQLTTIVLFDKNEQFIKSGAVIRIFAKLGWVGKFFYSASIIPQFIRDALYDWVAKKRYHWFGQLSSCRIPTKSESKFFLE